MIDSNGDSGERVRRRSKHPWNHPQLRLHTPDESPDEPQEPRCCKVTMTVTRSEFRAIRSRAGSRSVSEFLRQHVPAEILAPLPKTG